MRPGRLWSDLSTCPKVRFLKFRLKKNICLQYTLLILQQIFKTLGGAVVCYVLKMADSYLDPTYSSLSSECMPTRGNENSDRKRFASVFRCWALGTVGSTPPPPFPKEASLCHAIAPICYNKCSHRACGRFIQVGQAKRFEDVLYKTVCLIQKSTSETNEVSMRTQRCAPILQIASL